MIRRIVVAVLAVLVGATPTLAQDRPRVGVLKLTSSAPIFVGVEKGFFKEFGVEPELVFFQAAAPIATALAAGQIDVGATGLTAATYNIVLGGEKLWIVADKGREWPDHRLTAIVVRTDLHDAGLRTVADLKGRRIAVTQLGSTFHYQLGNILEKEGMSLKDVTIVPLQAMAAALEALKGRQVDALVLPQPFPGRAEAGGFGRIIAWGGDLFPWQIATVFYSKTFAADRRRGRRLGRSQPGPVQPLVGHAEGGVLQPASVLCGGRAERQPVARRHVRHDERGVHRPHLRLVHRGGLARRHPVDGALWRRLRTRLGSYRVPGDAGSPRLHVCPADHCHPL